MFSALKEASFSRSRFNEDTNDQTVKKVKNKNQEIETASFLAQHRPFLFFVGVFSPIDLLERAIRSALGFSSS